MKIDFLISNMTGGGAQRVISTLANNLDSRGHEVRIISFRGGDEYELSPTIERKRFNKKFLFNSVVFNGYFQLGSFYQNKANRPDLISSHINLLGYLTIPIAKIFGIKIIVSEHINHQVRQDFARRFLWNNLYPMADAVTILTSFDQEYFSKRNKNVVVMPNPSSFEVARLSINKERNKEILAIGQLDRYHHKGFDNLLKIAHRVQKVAPEWKFMIAGGGDQGRRHLEKLKDDLKVKNVTFLGQRSDIKDLLLASEIYVLPSRFEGLPMTLIEGMSQGTACIAYNCVSGPSDIINDRYDGLLVEDQNLESMVDGLLELIQNTELRKKLQKNAPSAVEKFSVETIVNKWENLVDKVLKSN